MQKETISVRQAVFMIAIYIIGTTGLIGMGTKSGQDTWISMLCSLVFIIPIILIYARIIKLFPEKDIFDIAEEVFGKIIGKIFTILITWYAIHLASMVLRNCSEFIQITELAETPQLPVMILFILIAVYFAKSGIKTIGKFGMVLLPIVLLVLLATFIFALRNIDFTNLMPIMNHSPKVIFSGSFQIFSFPFGETVLFLALAGSIKKGDNPYKIYLFGVIIALILLLLAFIRNIGTLGSALLEAEYFPSYSTTRIIEFSSFLERIESSTSMNLTLNGIIKLTVCVVAATKGLTNLFNMKDYKQMLFPTSLLIMAIGAILYTSTMQMMEFIKVYYIYAIPFQIIIPIAIWIVAEIKKRKKANPISV